MDPLPRPWRPSRAYIALSRIEIFLDRFTKAFTYVFVSLISLLLLAYTLLYYTIARPLLHASLHASHTPHTSTILFLHTALATWLLLSTTIHYALIVSTRPGRPRDHLDTEAPLLRAAHAPSPAGNPASGYRTASQEWRWCKVCAAPKPPRAHHDSTTGECALAMDHYCPATGGIVGLCNYPHFARFLVHACGGALFAAATCAYLARYMPPAAVGTWRGDAVFFAAAGSAAVGVAVGVLVAFHAYLVWTGQTTIEFYENWTARRAGLISGSPFDAGPKANFVAAFGGPLIAVLPWWSVLFLPDFRRIQVPLWMIVPTRLDEAKAMQLD